MRHPRHISARRGASSRQKPKAYTNERPDALELMARLLVSGSYRVPVAGTGTRPGLASTDIAAACGYMRSRLGREVALAVAMRTERAELSRVAGRAYLRCRRALRMMRPQTTLDFALPADRWRLRMIVYDALTELVHPEKRRPYRVLAKSTKMRAGEYTRAHKVVTAELQELMNNARREFAARLWGAP